MSLSEFELIKRYFEVAQPSQVGGLRVSLGIGDDCALLKERSGEELAVSIDTQVADVHFFSDMNPADIAFRSLAVNVSDLVAMGARPDWFTLALTLPEADEKWLADFSQGLFEAAQTFGIQLVGGDTTRGPLTITVQVAGYIKEGAALTRGGAKPGDWVYVSGTLGDAGLAVRCWHDDQMIDLKAATLNRYCRPMPHVELGQQLQGIASSCIDISDGLLADLGHICERSSVGAEIELNKIPLSPALLKYQDVIDNNVERYGNSPSAIVLAASSGDDYELCFSVPDEKLSLLNNVSTDVPLSCVGRIVAGDRVVCRQDGQVLSLKNKGFEHF